MNETLEALFLDQLASDFSVEQAQKLKDRYGNEASCVWLGFCQRYDSTNGWLDLLEATSLITLDDLDERISLVAQIMDGGSKV